MDYPVPGIFGRDYTIGASGLGLVIHVSVGYYTIDVSVGVGVGVLRVELTHTRQGELLIRGGLWGDTSGRDEGDLLHRDDIGPSYGYRGTSSVVQ